MYKLIRRISSSFFPRPDRPWSEDATSTAPQIGHKRRRSIDEHEERETTPSAKKQRAESEAAPESERGQSPEQPAKETEEVKEVTKGVRKVELEDGKTCTAESVEAESQAQTGAEEAAAVPLPDSPELKPADDTQDAEGEVDAEAVKDDTAAPIESSEIPEPTTKDAAPLETVEDEVPGLTLTSHAADKPTASSIPHTDTPAITDAPIEETSPSQ
ncbi:hypothetical protein C8Q70DRAFT_934826 [Cubamyces menziesii]|uniref:Uncharacterized protein n=1 Tax=Trametes cubensis TaxID=1111947 RepID=A0AAD7TSH5_9APHY|nr:hypothetical protein C8Q70DRAFT_934826 [Cubamyces menziesii]KAJ8481075.1 hypothetical protein ONZ51_g6232 [Trametes cubensis]